jgi:WD40 repeat protein
MPTTNFYVHNRIPRESLRDSGHSSMTPPYLYGILGSPWQQVPHMSIFLLYHLRRLVLLSLERGQLSHWPSSEMAISNFEAVVLSVAFSRDGRHIVSGSGDQTIRVWNARTGETVAGPFTGHTDSVRSVEFSPDGRHIVPGSDDRTIRVWNAMRGETAAGPFTGHTDWVRSVAFSPDGQHIVSGSDDRTIRVSSVTIVDFTDHL